MKDEKSPDDRRKQIKERLSRQKEDQRNPPVGLTKFNTTPRAINRTVIWEFRDRFPSKAMKDHPVWKKYPLLLKMLNTLEAKRIIEGKKEYVFLFHFDKSLYKKKGKKTSYPYAAFKTDNNFYETIIPVLGITQIALRKYLSELCKTGILVLLEKEGKHHVPIYALGYFSKLEDGYVLIPFLTIETMEMLDQFNPQFTIKKFRRRI